jgi:hypothetical protein
MRFQWIVLSVFCFVIVSCGFNPQSNADYTGKDVKEPVPGLAINPAISTAPFTIVVIPDSQHMPPSWSGGTPEMFNNEIKWIVDSAGSLNTVFVSHVGDIVEHGNIVTECIAATNAIDQLDNILPYGIAPGNHDADVMWTDNYTTYNRYYPAGKFIGKSWFGGCYNNTDVASYQLFSVDGMDFIIVHLRWGTNSSILSWASGVLDQYPNRRAIVSTHEFLSTGVTLSAVGNIIWNNVIKNHDNVFMVVCGHNSISGTTTLVNNFGHRVYGLVCDYQDTIPESGKLRYYTFKPANNSIEAYTYSTWNKTYDTSSSNQFTLSYTMTVSATTIVSGGIYELVAQCSGKALDVNGSSTSAGAKVQQWTRNNSSAQRWKITDMGNGLKLTAQCSGMALDCTAWGTNNGTKLEQWNDNGGACQRFGAVLYGTYWKFYTVLSGARCVDVSGASAADGAQVQLWDDNGGTAQRWALYRY